jgi:hypothetical protein
LLGTDSPIASPSDSLHHDLLITAQLQILNNQRRPIPSMKRIAPINRRSQNTKNSLHFTAAQQSELRQLWEIVEQPPIKTLSDAERPSEQPDRAQAQRTSKGRSNVAFDDRLPSRGASKTLEIKRIALRNLRSQRDQQLELESRAIVQEYQDLRHRTRVITDHSAHKGQQLAA